MANVKLAMLWSDWIVWGLFTLIAILFFILRKNPQFKTPWRQVLNRKLGMIAMIILG
ncbi:unnamed protein product, partial [marine sediment metagenome]